MVKEIRKKPIYRGVSVMLFFVMTTCMVLGMSGCGYKRRYFPAEELAGYRNPIVFMEDSESKETYFIHPDEPEKRYPLDFIEIFDYNEENQTFLFSTERDGEEYIAEYDLKNMEYTCLLGENTIAEKIDKTNDKSIINAHYFPEQGKISFTYTDYDADHLVVYDMQKETWIYYLKKDHSQTYEICGWKDSETGLFFKWVDDDDVYDIMEVDVTGEAKRIKGNVGRDIVFSRDMAMATGNGVENWFGIYVEPVVVWDMQKDKVIRFHESDNTMARTQLSEDNQYVMLAQYEYETGLYSLMCIRIKDEKVCVIYETDDYIRDVLW